MPTLTLEDLRTPQTVALIRARVLARLQAAGAPVADWTATASGGVENSTVDAVATALEQLLAARLADMVSGRFLDFAEGDFLRFLAARYYRITPREATFTVQNVRLSLVASASQQTFSVGDLWVRSKATGRQYQSITGGDLLPGRTLDLQFQAENAGSAYSDVAGTIDTMVTAPAGVSCVNIAPSPFLPARLTGTSTGKVVADFSADAVPAYDSIRIAITASGEVGTAAFKFSTDGGSTWSDAQPVVSTFLGAADSVVTFTNGTAPSFIIGDIFTILKGNAILVQGSDAESDPALRNRCRARRASLSDVPVGKLVELWASVASAEVSKAQVDADPNTPGGIIVTIASHAGPASAAAQIEVTDYIQARLLGYQGVQEPSPGAGSPAEKALVRSAVRREITCAGTVSVPRARVGEVQQEAERLWLAHLQGLDIGPSTVRLSELQQQVQDAGAVTFENLTLNGVAANVAVLAGEVAVPATGTTLLASLVWRPI